MSSPYGIALIYLGRRGGIAHYTLELARALQSECRMSCHFSTHNVLAPELRRLDCDVHFYPTYTGFLSCTARTLAMSGPRRIARALSAENTGLILDTGSGPWSDLLCRMTGRLPWVRVIHDSVLHQDRWKPLLALHRAMFPMHCAALIGVSDFSTAALRLRFPATPVIATRHGIICGGTAADIDDIVARRKNFLFFGRIEPYKGIAVLLDAFESAKHSDPELRLIVCGSGRISAQLRKRFDLLEVELRNEWVEENEVGAMFARAGVVVLPYLTATQSGVAAIAIAKGLPIIATNVGALPEQVVDGVNGRVVPAGDAPALAAAMLEISASGTLARRFATGSVHLGKTEYSWNTISARLIDDLKHLPMVRQTSLSLQKAGVA